MSKTNATKRAVKTAKKKSNATLTIKPAKKPISLAEFFKMDSRRDYCKDMIKGLSADLSFLKGCSPDETFEVKLDTRDSVYVDRSAADIMYGNTITLLTNEVAEIERKLLAMGIDPNVS